MKQKALIMGLLGCLLLTGCQGAASEKESSETDTDPISYTNAVVSYLGPEGTYTQEACDRFFGGEGTYVPYATVADAVNALQDGKSDYAVIPQENTIGGPVIDYVDLLISEEDVFVCGETELPITQNLLILPGAPLDQIKTVYSHKQGIAQGKQWLEKNLPDAEVIEVSSTAEGARMVSEAQNPALAAIASASSAKVYGLQIAAESIQNSDANKTRFYVLTMNEPKQKNGDRAAFIASGKASDLPSLMSEIDKLNVSLVTLHARPLKTELGQYCYLIECAQCTYDAYEKLKSNSPFSFRYLGCFDVR
jgi:prephenate dehydratase